MKDFLLQIDLQVSDFRFGIMAFITAFVIAMVLMPPLIKLIHRFKLFDVPDLRKEHVLPVPTMGGIAACAGMATGCILWYRFTGDAFTISFFFATAVLMFVGIMDDLHNMPARYKLVIQAGAFWNS
jgi:UDP-GlcNAc:undecaprenyl-phosphate/decaprenyl-phosphate GlcNAc-1-phosphate transferase